VADGRLGKGFRVAWPGFRFVSSLSSSCNGKWVAKIFILEKDLKIIGSIFYQTVSQN
jgi:hypothetical protein